MLDSETDSLQCLTNSPFQALELCRPCLPGGNNFHQRRVTCIHKMTHLFALHNLNDLVTQRKAQFFRNSQRSFIFRTDLGNDRRHSPMPECIVHTSARTFQSIAPSPAVMFQDITHFHLRSPVNLPRQKPDLPCNGAGFFILSNPVGIPVLFITAAHPPDPLPDFLIGKNIFPGIHYADILHHLRNIPEVRKIHPAQNQPLRFHNHISFHCKSSFPPARLPAWHSSRLS